MGIEILQLGRDVLNHHREALVAEVDVGGCFTMRCQGSCKLLGKRNIS